MARNTNTKMNGCALCKKDHRLLVCLKYKEANVDERWNIVKRTRLCFRCIRFRHRRTECTGPPCMKCGNSSHHISLCRSPKKLENYFVATRDEENSRVSMSYRAKHNVQSPEKKRELIHARNDDGKIYLKIIPVDLYGPKGQIRVLALLDEGSTVTLLDSSVAEKIGAYGKKQSFTITAIDGSRIKTNNSRRIKLKIKGAHRELKDEIEVRTIEDLKVMEQGVDTKVLKDHPHLSDIRKELIYTSERPKLLIGQDNWGLIFTKKIKEGKTSNLVASLTKLGWVLHGCDKKSNATVNFISHVEVKEDKPKEMFRQCLKTESWGVHTVLPRDKRRPLEVLKNTAGKIPNERQATKLLRGKTEDAPPHDQTRQTKKQSCRIESSPNLQWEKINPRNIKKFVAPCLTENKDIMKQGYKRNQRMGVIGPSTKESTDDATRKMPNRFNRATWYRNSVRSRNKENEWPVKNNKRKIEMIPDRETRKMVVIIDSMGNVTKLNPGPDSRIVIVGYNAKFDE